MIWRAWRSEGLPILGLAIAAVGFVTGHLVLLAVGLFIWGLVYVAGRMAHRALQHLDVHLVLREAVTEPGRAADSEFCLKNPMPWPLMQVEWTLTIPTALTARGPGEAREMTHVKQQTLTGKLWVGPREEVRIRYQLTGVRRGRWPVGPGSFILHDPLSQTELVREDQEIQYLTVWPRRYSPPQSLWAASLKADRAAGRPWEMPDPLSVKGIRPYLPGDSVRHLAAYATARTQQLMVKELEPLTDQRVHVMLHPGASHQAWYGVDPEQFEDAISAAASLVEAAVLQGFAVELWATGAIPGHMRGIHLSARHPTELATLLTALAWLQPSGTMDDDLGALAAEFSQKARETPRLWVVSPRWPDLLTRALLSPPRRGLRPLFVAVASEIPGDVPSSVGPRWGFWQGRWFYA
ncbi:MAG: DUF58 domain-containing protein [Firmicutes bacterium]|nr:DUF58 domain-containing protein [Bacillota bacterium]